MVELIEASIMPDGQIETLVKIDGEYKMLQGNVTKQLTDLQNKQDNKEHDETRNLQQGR